jgi:hypothetical protein
LFVNVTPKRRGDSTDSISKLLRLTSGCNGMGFFVQILMTFVFKKFIGSAFVVAHVSILSHSFCRWSGFAVFMLCIKVMSSSYFTILEFEYRGARELMRMAKRDGPRTLP